MPVIKVKYFQARGRAECIRWILEYAGAKYEDVRFEREAWPEEKKSMNKHSPSIYRTLNKKGNFLLARPK